MAIARRLGVSEEELKNIDESKPSVQEKCFHSLRMWQSRLAIAIQLLTAVGFCATFMNALLRCVSGGINKIEDYVLFCTPMTYFLSCSIVNIAVYCFHYYVS
jgi:hypothetical protein